MERYGPETDGDGIADLYDDLHMLGNTDVTVEMLISLAGSGRALELAVGTGRVAIPLVERGVEMHGIDASDAMVRHLRAKPGGDLTDGRLRQVGERQCLCGLVPDRKQGPDDVAAGHSRNPSDLHRYRGRNRIRTCHLYRVKAGGGLRTSS